MKLSGLIIMMVMLTASGVSLAADDWRGGSNGSLMTRWFGVYPAAMDTKLAVSASSGLVGTPVNFDADSGRERSGSALFASLNWLIGSRSGYLDDGMESSGQETDASLFLTDSGVRWKPFRKLGLALNYSLFPLDGEYSNDSIETELDLDYMGPRLSFDIAF